MDLQLKKILITLIGLNASIFFSTNSDANLYSEKPIQKSMISDQKMHIFLCGTGDPEVTMQEIRKPACMAILVNKHLMLIDAGEGSIQTLASLGLPYQSINTIFISHWHSDHFAGLAQVINASWYNGRKQAIHVYGPKGVKQVLGGIKQAYQLDTQFRTAHKIGTLNPSLAYGIPRQINAVNKDQLVYKKDHVKITAFEVDHQPVYPALGFQINYKGCKIIVSGDTKVIPSLASHADNADILINEALSHPLYKLSIKNADGNKTEIENAEQTKSYHSDSLLLAKMAEQAHVKNLILTHLVPAIPTTDVAVKSFIAGMNVFYSKAITVAADKDEIEISSSGDHDCQVRYIPSKKIDIMVHKVGEH